MSIYRHWKLESRVLFLRNVLPLSTFYMLRIPQISSVTVVSNSSDRFPCSSPTPRASSNSCPSIQWCHPTISSSIIHFSSCLQSFQASGSFPVSQFFASDGQSFGVSVLTSVLQMNIQDWFPLGWTGWISLWSKGLSRVFSNTTVQNHQYFCTQLSL